MRILLRRLIFLSALLGVTGTSSAFLSVQEPTDEEPTAKSKPTAKTKSTPKSGLRIIDPVVCRSIEGYEDYEKLPDAAQTSEEKLLVYYRPKGFKVDHRGDEYVAHLVQDGQIRRLGEKKVLLRKAKLLDFEAKASTPPGPLYIRNSFSLKGLSPGEYEYDMILTDANAPESTTTASVKFRVIPVELPKADETEKP